MKTAIIKTDFWKDDKIYNLSIDARLLYLCILTNPERNGTPALKVSDRYLVSQTGFNSNQIEVARKLLIDTDLIQFVDGYYIINNQDYVEPKKGKLSASLYDKDFNSLPENIQYLLKSGSRVALECIGISNSISKDNTDGFNSFWEMYPTRRTNKEKCRIKFNKLSKEEQFKVLLDVKIRKDRDEKWLKGYVPETITYLNNRKWEDDIQEVIINEDDQIVNDIILVFKESGISIPDKIKEDKIEKRACIELFNSKGIEKVRNILEYCMENKVFYNFTTPNKLLTNYEAIRLSKINKDKK